MSFNNTEINTLFRNRLYQLIIIPVKANVERLIRSSKTTHKVVFFTVVVMVVVIVVVVVVVVRLFSLRQQVPSWRSVGRQAMV